MKSESWLPSLWKERKGAADPFTHLRSQMDDLINDWAGGFGGLAPWPAGASTLRIDVSETPSELTVKADLPGVDQKDIDITVSGDRLSIRAEKKSEKDEKKEDKGRIYHRVERSYGSFERSISLPFEADPQTVSADFSGGVLTIKLPKPAEVQRQARQIEIKSTG